MAQKIHGPLCNAQEMALLQRLTYLVCFDDVVIILILTHGKWTAFIAIYFTFTYLDTQSGTDSRAEFQEVHLCH